jgi:predicted PurR-regulated permease PerM
MTIPIPNRQRGDWPWWILALILTGGWLLYLLAPILTPFLIAALLAYLGDPLADRLEEKKLTRTWSVVIVFTLFTLTLLLLLLLVAPLFERQISSLLQAMPARIEWLRNEWLPWLNQTLGIETFDIGLLRAGLGEHWQSAGSLLGSLLSSVTKSGAAVAAWLANLLLIPVVTFYLLRDWDRLVASLRELLPRHIEPTATRLVAEIDEVLGAFLRGQLSVMAALAAIYSTGLWLIGLEVALLVGTIAGLVSFVPYLGFVVGIAAAGVAIVMQTHQLIDLLWVVGVFGIAQAIEGMVLTPMLVGDRIGLHPVAVIFAVLAGGQLFGFFGILLALPLAAAIAVLLRHLRHGYLNSLFYSQRCSDE